MKKESSVSMKNKDTKTKVEKKNVKVKKNVKTDTKKVSAKKTKAVSKNTKKEKKNIFKMIIGFFSDVKKEMKKVHLPSKKEMAKYSLATVYFIVFFSLFFYIIDIIFAFIKSLA